MVFVFGAQTTNILPTNKATFAYLYLQCKQQPRKYYPRSDYCLTTNVLFPENYRLYGIQYTGFKFGREVWACKHAAKVWPIPNLLTTPHITVVHHIDLVT